MTERTDTSHTPPAPAGPWHPRRWICARGELSGWEKHCWVSENKAERFWLLSPLPSPAAAAMLSVPPALPAGSQVWGRVTCLAGGVCRCWHQGLAALAVGSEAEAVLAGAVEAPGCVDAELAAAVARAGTFIHVWNRQEQLSQEGTG